MLLELSIENLGIIESSRLTFSGGFTVLTGETGAGKTMLVEAINLVCGRRAEISAIRDGADEAHVEARFVRATPDGGEEEIILARTLHREGRSRAYVNGRMATVTALAELAEELVDIHGQHGHQRLMTQSAQRDSLDAYARVDLSSLRAARDELVDIDAMLAALGGDEKSRVREMDLLSFQCQEIESAALHSDDEDEVLSREEDMLSGVVKHQQSLMAVVELLGGDGGALEGLQRATREVSQVPRMEAEGERLAALAAEADDVLRVVRQLADGIEEDPERLEFLRLRRQSLRDLQRKYGDTLADVRRFGREARARLDELTGYAERVAQLESQREAALARLRAAQQMVGDARRAAAPALALAIQQRLRDLAMPHAEVQVAVGDAASDLAGESVTIMLAANPGSAPAPLSKVASGGELARVMLALRLVLTSDPATMVFDEVDAGIGGAAAVAVASALRELGRDHQVLVVTHLAQVAASAHHHVSVSKRVEKGRTFGTATPLDPDSRTAEVARMLSGGVADQSALAHAEELLRQLRLDDDSTRPKKSRSTRR